MEYCKDPKSRMAELHFITRVYASNGFPPTEVQKIMGRTKRAWHAKHQNVQPAPPVEQEEQPVRVAFPFIPSVFYPLCRLGRRIGIQVVAQKSTSLSAILCSKAKHRLPKEQESGVVYQVECDCGKRYTGETEREVSVRIAEHELAHRNGANGKAFSAHLHHQPAFLDFKILAKEPRHDLRMIKEAVYISKDQGNAIDSQSDWVTNKNLGRDYSPVWTEVVERVQL